MNLINSESPAKVRVRVDGRTITAVVDSVDYIEEDRDIKVSYHFDEDFYLTDDVEWLNAERMPRFEMALQRYVAKSLDQIMRRQEFLNAAEA